MPLLEVEKLVVRFGGVTALDGLDLVVETGSLVSVIGPNGAGKTTLFNVIAGAQRPTGGVLHFDGKSIGGLGPVRMSHLGIARTFQVPKPFRSLSVRENVRLAAAGERLLSPLGALRLRSRSTEAAETADQLLAFTGLGGLADRRASDLNMGQLRRLELARALAGRPRLLLLDEPAAGIGADGMPELARLIDSIHARGVTVLLVEHHVGFALSLCDRAVVLDEGRMIAEGDPEVIRTDPRVITAYLGRAPAVARKVPTKPSGNPAEDAAEPSPFGTEHR